MICGIPLPILSGSHFTKKAVNNPKIANMINHTIIKKIFPFINRKEKASIKFSKPKSKEAWLVSIADLLVSIRDSKFFIKYKASVAYLMIISIFLQK